MDIELKQEIAERAFQLEQRLSLCLLNIRNDYLELGKVASELKAGKLYKVVCPEAKTWSHYITLRFDGISRASLDNYGLVARLLGNDIADRDIPLGRAIDIARVISHIPKDEVEDTKAELIESAATLPKEGWENTLRVARGQMPSDVCEHEETELWKKCCVKGGCGKFLGKV